ncbi:MULTISPECIES: DUF1513 domain-containing protein [unclassified Polaromonas]|uniref:DUF1513 domain-containing protein n=1 Tax=unclassified Polaromonas TaxID=2638319 RepID=UPI000F08E3BD|nr:MULTISPECIES: DUF1513 domain-containing protein [unclassified Polaromonas]AYQ28085.1 DUF1513 domain-containing protein [Polaromonas sp. SP1]QGJ17050.1 DUF1513 domain-containing protein [Polaromonas sp. Pch-P]
MREPFTLHRRQWLVHATAYAAALAAPLALPAGAAARALQLAAAWEGSEGYQVGVLTKRGAALAVCAALDVPTRAHGVWVEAGGTLLAVARRPGDWLLRWKPDVAQGGQAIAWGWIEPDRAFNGHVIASPDGKRIYTTETHLETGQGLIGIRDAATLEKTGEWPTHGMDPHELLLDADGSLVVANGGIPALPETGRLKLHMERMDASLVRLDTRTGELRGQWRLADQRLSLRHIAWAEGAHTVSGQRLLGIALQAEHDDAAAKAAAPVLAVFDGQRLQTRAAGPGQQLAGYGGDIAPAGGGFAVSCPRANGVALWRADGEWAGFLPLQEACALAAEAPQKHQAPNLWAAGRLAAITQDSRGAVRASALKELRLDNHWAPLG